MKRLVGLSAVLMLVLGSAAFGRMQTLSMFELAQQSDVVFTGMVTKLDETSATVQLDKILQGKIDAKAVVVTPITQFSDVGRYPNIKEGEAVLLLGKRGADGVIAICGNGEGKIALDPKTAENQIAGMRRILEITQMKEEDARNLAILGEATSGNQWLRAVCLRYVSGKFSDSKLRENYVKQFMVLLASGDPAVQRAGLDAIRSVDAPEALPRVIELTRSKDAGVVDSASMVLGRHDTPEAAAALITLTRSDNPNIRIRAAIDLSDSRQPGAKAALAALLDDKSAEVRAIAPRGLVFLLRDGKADDLIPKVAALLQDTNEDVVKRAADALGEPRNVEAIPPLLDLLQKEGISNDVRYFALQAVYCHYSKDHDPAAQAMIDKHMDVVIAALKNDRATGSFSPAFQAVGILSLCRSPEAGAALDWAAQSHPSQEIRDYAKRSLGK